jgi:hypothetical protein
LTSGFKEFDEMIGGGLGNTLPYKVLKYSQYSTLLFYFCNINNYMLF